MIRVVATTLFALVLVVAGSVFSRPAGAQSGDVDAVKAKFGSLTQSAAEAQGWKVDTLCVDATSLGMPAASGAMGFHASKPGAEMGMAAMLDPLAPQELVFDPTGRIVAVEYQVLQANG